VSKNNTGSLPLRGILPVKNIPDDNWDRRKREGNERKTEK